MKLRYQGLVLIGVPLICQMAFVPLLLSTIARLEQAAQSEAHAKEVLAKCEELRISVMSTYTTLFTLKLVQPKEYAALYQYSQQLMQKKMDTLRNLVKDYVSSSSLVEEYLRTLSNLLDLFGDFAVAVGQGQQIDFVNFAGFSEHIEKVNFYLQRLRDQSLRISELYTPLVQEFSPAAERRRQELKMVIFAALAANALMALVLAVGFARNAVMRLSRLTSNIESFNRGKVELPAIGGNDELSDLDNKFREMAKARHASDEIRRSVLAMVSHDMRSPLASISFALDLALSRNDAKMDPKLEKMLRQVNSESLRLNRLASNLLEIEKIETGHVNLNLADCLAAFICEQSLNAVQGLADIKQISLETEIASDESMPCDADRIIQVLINLLSNAIKFSPQASKIILRCSRPGDKVVRFEVIDEGPGIAPEDKDRIFEKFKQLHQSSATKRQGSGLGLSICKALIESHKGKIGVDSELGKGSCFWLELPAEVAWDHAS